KIVIEPLGGVPISGSVTATGHSTRWTGPFGVSCSCGSGVSTSAPGELLRNDGGYHFLHDRCRLYQMVGKVSHLEGLRRKPPEEDDRRAGCDMWPRKLCGAQRTTPLE